MRKNGFHGSCAAQASAEMGARVPGAHCESWGSLETILALQPTVSARTAVKAGSACFGAIVTSLAVTPLDVVKVRLQALSASTLSTGPGVTPAACSLCGDFVYNTGLMEHRMPKHTCNFFSPHFLNKTKRAAKQAKDRALRRNQSFGNMFPPRMSAPFGRAAASSMAANASANATTMGVLTSIARNEGIFALWDGLRPTLLMSVPNTMLYMVLYDELSHNIFPDLLGWSMEFSAVIAGGASRVVSGTVVAPLELIRTQMQAQSGAAEGGILAKVRMNVQSSEAGYLSLWRGLSPTLWRDVPFSALYWASYEIIRQHLLQHPGIFPQAVSQGVFMPSFISGAAAGSIAALLTTPFDVVKTRRQVDLYQEPVVEHAHRGCGKRSSPPQILSGKSAMPRGTFRVMADIVRTESWSSLFIGSVPRVAKVAPACAIMISSYEMGKALFGLSSSE